MIEEKTKKNKKIKKERNDLTPTQVNSLAAINADLGPDPSYSMISTVFTLISGVRSA